VKGFKAKGIQGLQLFALIDQAHRHGLTVTGHLDSGSRGSVNPRDAIFMGIDRIEHFMGGDAIVATANAYKDPRLFTLALDEMRYLTPRARQIVEARLPTLNDNQQFKRIYEVS
jgi:hypothetical protein